MSQGEPVNTWDIVPARRPSLNDMGGAVAQNNARFPPDPNTMPTAEQYNQLQQQCQALAKVSPVCIIDIINSGSASLARFTAPGTNIVNGTFTLTYVGTGHIRIEWASGTFPVSVVNPIVQMTTDNTWLAPVVIPISNGVEVKTWDNTASPADGNFTIAIY